MSRRKSAKFTRKEVDDAKKMADELEIDEIEQKAIDFVHEDTRFTWTLAALMSASLIVIRADYIDWPVPEAGHIGMREMASLGLLFAVYVILAIRNERIRTAMTIVIAHGIKRSRLEKTETKEP